MSSISRFQQPTTSGATTSSGVPSGAANLNFAKTYSSQQSKSGGQTYNFSAPTPTTQTSGYTTQAYSGSSASALSGLLSSLSKSLSDLYNSFTQAYKGSQSSANLYGASALGTLGGIFGSSTTQQAQQNIGKGSSQVPQLPLSMRPDLYSIRKAETTPAFAKDKKLYTETGFEIEYGQPYTRPIKEHSIFKNTNLQFDVPKVTTQQINVPQKQTTNKTEQQDDILFRTTIPTEDNIFTEAGLTFDGLDLFMNTLGGEASSGQYVYRDPLGGATPLLGHIIKSGETLSKIAKQYGTTVDDILRLNKDNKLAIKSPDLIIAGQQILVPNNVQSLPADVRVQRELQTNLPKTTQDINQKIQDIYQKIKSGDIDNIKMTPDLAQKLVFKMVGDELRDLEVQKQKLDIYDNPRFYQDQYQQLLQQSGAQEAYQRYFDLNKILNQTRNDVMQEAAAAGGIVTQSQIEEIVNWRTSLIKGEMQALSDLIEIKEKAIDKMMNYVKLDRDYLDRLFDTSLGISERKRKVITDSIKWYYDWTENITKYNKTKLTTAINTGAFANYSNKMLLEMSNPDSPLYTGYSIEELINLKQVSKLLLQKKQQDLVNNIERLRMAEERLRMQQNKTNKGISDQDILEIIK